MAFAETKDSPSLHNVPRDLERDGELNGYTLNLEKNLDGDQSSVKLACDGTTVLIPQPSDDPEDPLNWSYWRKFRILIIISLTSFLPDYGCATGAVTLLQQATLWGLTPDYVNHSQVGNIFTLGAGGIFVIILAAYFGRLPVLFWFTVMAFATACWCAGATSFQSFMAARILNGFFSTVAQAGGLMFIKDLFFLHQHARAINVWDSFIILSPYFGPMLAAFMISKLSWRWPFWVYSIMTGVCVILIVLFVDETYYDRSIPAKQQPPRGSRIRRLTGISQWKSRRYRNTISGAIMRSIAVISKPGIFLCSVYYLFTFAWVVGTNSTLAIFLTPLYNFGLIQVGAFYATPIISVTLGQIIGHYLHDAIANRYIRSHRGRLEPEARLIVIYFSEPFMLAGLVLLGFALQRQYHWIVAALGWGLYTFGIMVTTVGLQAYMLDSYPEGSGEVSAWLNFARTTGGFIISYFQVRWAKSKGTESMFGTQAIVCLLVFCIIPLLHWRGKALRKWAGPLNFHTN